MWTDQNYAKSGFALKNITLGLNICTLNIKITYENDIPLGQMMKIVQNLDSQKITLHWITICVPRTYGLHMKNIFHGGKSRLLKIWIRRKHDYTGREYLYPKHGDYI
jgi:hypothetical protein